ncbi:oligosaccharide flippase family protein [Novosphingobium sp.]|uniref:oligosaccharide flippase family protein n=1 Tax=Novosphingobium sp. TaxID=1874826 RepID=UPI003B52DC69
MVTTDTIKAPRVTSPPPVPRNHGLASRKPVRKAADGASTRAVGAAGLALARIAAQAMQFGLFLYAARVLTTADFGLFSLAFAIIVGLAVLAEAGWREWVICAAAPRQIDEAGTAALATGALIAACGLGAIALARQLGLALPLLTVAGLLLPWAALRPLVCVQMGLLTRAQRLTSMAVVQTLCEAAGFVTGVFLLHRGAGLASLAWAKLALLAVELGGYTLCLRRLGLAVPALAELRRMARFSWHILAARMLVYVQGNLTTLVIGAAVSPALVGIYRAAMRLGGTAQELIREPARAVGWSWLRSAIDHDAAQGDTAGRAGSTVRRRAASASRLHATAHQFLDIAVTIGAVLFLTVALQSATIVRLLLGAKWSGAAVLVTLLSVGMIARLPQALAEPLFPLLGKARLTRQLALLTTGTGLGCFLLGLPFGITAVALADMIAALLMLMPTLFFLVAEGGLSLRLALRPYALAAISGLGCVALAHMLPQVVPQPGASGALVAGLLMVRNSLALVTAYAALQLIARLLLPADIFREMNPATAGARPTPTLSSLLSQGDFPMSQAPESQTREAPTACARSSRPLRVAVIIASTGRPGCVGDVIADLRRQTQLPSHIVISVTGPRDLPPASALVGAEVVISARGAATQRNSGLDHLAALDTDCDVVVFFDDDFVPSRHAIAGMARLFGENPAIVGATGAVLADGIKTPGIPYARAREIVANHDRAYERKHAAVPVMATGTPDLYGCNMAYRLSAITDLRFDERLKLYAWQEDVDFSVRTGSRGRLVKTDAFVGVHLGIKSGRTSGVRLGYSQIQNPIYLWRKGTMPTAKAWGLMARNLASNHVRTLWPEPWVDRFGRVRGNWMGFADVLRGRLTPERIEDL